MARVSISAKRWRWCVLYSTFENLKPFSKFQCFIYIVWLSLPNFLFEFSIIQIRKERVTSCVLPNPTFHPVRPVSSTAVCLVPTHEETRRGYADDNEYRFEIFPPCLYRCNDTSTSPRILRRKGLLFTREIERQRQLVTISVMRPYSIILSLFIDCENCSFQTELWNSRNSRGHWIFRASSKNSGFKLCRYPRSLATG